ncbi:hypothetical protein GCM10027167_71920 [Nocardia heshunensis]
MEVDTAIDIDRTPIPVHGIDRVPCPAMKSMRYVPTAGDSHCGSQIRVIRCEATAVENREERHR